MKIDRKIKKIFPYLIENKIKGFDSWNTGTMTLSISDLDLDSQISLLVNKLTSSKKFFICRMSDGEYTFLLGHQPPVMRNTNFLIYGARLFLFLLNQAFKKNISAETKPGVSSGEYDLVESKINKKNIISGIKAILNNGVLALHLTYPKVPFQEKFHLPLVNFLKKNQILLSKDNYIPFYAIYALFHNKKFKDFLRGRSVTLLTGGTGDKIKKIKTNLKNIYKISDINWYQISKSKSLYDKIDNNFEFNNIILVGAGIGKFNLFRQLNEMDNKFLVIDVGYLLEYWADIGGYHNRPYIKLTKY